MPSTAPAGKPSTDGRTLRLLRYRRGLTIEDVVRRLAEHHDRPIHADHLRNIETGRRNASAPLAFALASVLKVTVDEIMDRQS